MTPFAHAGHWAAQLLYLAPVLAMVGAILWAKIRGRDSIEDETKNLDKSSSSPGRSEWQPMVLALRTSGINRAGKGIPRARTMSSGDLRSLLDGVPDTCEIVLHREREWSPVRPAWRDAAEEAAARWRSGVSARRPRLRRLPRRPGPRGRGPGRAAHTQTSLTRVS